MTTNGVVSARLQENPNSERLWVPVGEININPDGLPVKQTGEILFSELERKNVVIDHSMTLYFASRIYLKFEGTDYHSAVTSPVAVIYIHPAPKAPEICFVSHQLGEDYYGRTQLRITFDECQDLNSKYKTKLSVAPGEIKDIEKFSDLNGDGLIGPQAVFKNHSLFDIFPMLTAQLEDTPYTVGVNYYRDSDGRESEPKLESFEIRRIDK